MKRRASPSLSIVVVLGVAACTAPGLDAITSYDEPPDVPSTTASTSSTSPQPAPTTSGGEIVTATTGEPGTSTAGGGSTGPLDPLGPPAIVEHTLAPDPLKFAGPIATLIATADADGVRMQLDGAAPTELALAEPDAFHGEFALFSALANGDHLATFVAWRDALESAPLTIPFTVALPEAGSESFWDSDSAIGEGTVVALAVTPNHHLIELGTYYPMGQIRCYLRRRDLGGAWDPVEIIEVLPGTPCTATDLAVDTSGAIHVLASKFENNEARWWLGKLDTWPAPPLLNSNFINVGTGAPGETAQALAIDPTQLAVCGTKPAVTNHAAAVWTFSPNQPGKVLSFDHVLKDKPQLGFVEVPGDCVFSATHLVLAGEAWGPHDVDNTKRNRHFLLEIDLVTDTPLWTVAGPGPGTQSTASVITVDTQGRYITGGHTCDDNCSDPAGELRMFLPGGAQIWQRALDPGIASPQDIAFGPAGYFVFVSAKGQDANDTAFFAQAWFPLKNAPLWSYDHHDAPELQSAAALAFGPYGQIYAGGAGAGGYPAIAIIAP